MLKNYPWKQLERGQGFFVPAVDLAAVREAGLKAAVRQHVRPAHAAFVIKQGQLGVFFYRGPRVQKWRSEFSQP